MADNKRRIFWGAFYFTTDDVLLQPPEGDFVDVDLCNPLDLSITEAQFQHQRVSILGRLGQRFTGSKTVRSIIAEKVILQEEVARRAFEIYQSGEGGSAFDNWLRAERELLGL